MKQKRIVSELQLILTLLFVVALVVSNIITSKQVLLPFNITMTGAVFIFPITYILSDLISEVYGYRWSRVTCYLGFAANLFAAIVFSLVIKSPAPSYWENQEAFQIVLGSTPRILVSSLLAFVVGDFVNDRQTGRGIYTWADGDRYEGGFINDRRTGRGIYIWGNGNQYEGDWVDNKQHGRGVFAWANGERYEGDFVEDQRTGRGIYTWPDGRRYVGEFVDGYLEGYGTFVSGNGEKKRGLWLKNQFQG